MENSDEPIRIKNWRKFQHYSYRKPPWIKLYRELLDDLQWHTLEPAAAKTLISLWLLASEYDGEIPSIEIISFRLHTSPEKLRLALSRLSHWLEADASNTLASCEQHATSELETETEREAEPESRPVRSLALRTHRYDRPKSNFEKSAEVTADAISRVLTVPRKVDDRVHPRLQAADDGSDSVGLPRNAVRSKRG